jgi:ATP-dependent Clp protease ATP-binding subunit ClpA
LIGAQASSPVGKRDAGAFGGVHQRAVIHVLSSGREEVTGANVLVALFAERESHAVHSCRSRG